MPEERDQRPILRFGGQSAGPDGGFAILAYSTQLAAAVKEFIRPAYGSVVKVLGITTRVDGELHSWGEPGPEAPVWSRQDRSVRIDFVIPESLWKGKDHEQLRVDYLNAMDSGVEVLLEHIERKGLAFDLAAFREDWEKAKADYLRRTVEEPRRGFRTPSGHWVNPKGF